MSRDVRWGIVYAGNQWKIGAFPRSDPFCRSRANFMTIRAQRLSQVWFSFNGVSPAVGGLLAGWLFVSGCGSSTYSERLALADARNGYFANLNATLEPYSQPREMSGFDVWIRPQKGLRFMPAPSAKAADATDAPPDPRREFEGVPLDLPGLIGAWDGNLSVAGGGTGHYRLYVLGNHSRFLGSEADQGANPADFLNDLEVALSILFEVMLPPGDKHRGDQPNQKFTLQVPPEGAQFAKSEKFNGINFVGSAERDPALPFQAWLYERTGGPVQVAVLMLTPPSTTNDVRQALLTSLESLEFSTQPPRFVPRSGGQSGAAGGAAPAAPGGAPARTNSAF